MFMKNGFEGFTLVSEWNTAKENVSVLSIWKVGNVNVFLPFYLIMKNECNIA